MNALIPQLDHAHAYRHAVSKNPIVFARTSKKITDCFMKRAVINEHSRLFFWVVEPLQFNV